MEKNRFYGKFKARSVVGKYLIWFVTWQLEATHFEGDFFLKFYFAENAPLLLTGNFPRRVIEITTKL